jgi:hypothetical protein
LKLLIVFTLAPRVILQQFSLVLKDFNIAFDFQSISELLQGLLNLGELFNIDWRRHSNLAEFLNQWELHCQVVVIIIHKTGSFALFTLFLFANWLFVFIDTIKCNHLILADDRINFILDLLSSFSIFLISVVGVGLCVLTVGPRAVRNQVLTNINILHVWVLFNAFQLLGFPDALLLCLFGFSASLFLLVALLISSTLFLVLASLFFTSTLFLEILILALFALQKGLLGLLKPQDVLNELLFDFKSNHLLIVVLFSFVLLGLEVGNLFSNFGTLIVDLLQLSSVTLLGVVNIFVLFLNFIDFAIDCT